MRMFKNFKIKLLISVLIGVISSLYQIELKDELHVTSKKVMLSKNRLETFEYLSNLENYPNVSALLLVIQQNEFLRNFYTLLSFMLFYR